MQPNSAAVMADRRRLQRDNDGSKENRAHEWGDPFRKCVIVLMIGLIVLCALGPFVGWESCIYAFAFLAATATAYLCSFGAGRWLSMNAATDEAAYGNAIASAVPVKGSEEEKNRAIAAMRHLDSERAKGLVEMDPLWGADWTNLPKPPPMEPEVFEMNDTPTWLSRLQQRRCQAERAGKKKLAQKIEREIADAERAHKTLGVQPIGIPRMPSARNCAVEGLRNRNSGSADAGDDDVWGMDWAAWTPREQCLPWAVAA